MYNVERKRVKRRRRRGDRRGEEIGGEERRLERRRWEEIGEEEIGGEEIGEEDRRRKRGVCTYVGESGDCCSISGLCMCVCVVCVCVCVVFFLEKKASRSLSSSFFSSTLPFIIHILAPSHGTLYLSMPPFYLHASLSRIVCKPHSIRGQSYDLERVGEIE